jgi:glycine hydroxymethyltransferase
VSATGQIFNAVQYEVDHTTGMFDYDKIADVAKKHKPKIIISGATAYPRLIDFKIFREIADRVGAYLVSDIAHIAGLVAGGVHPSPVPYADVVTTTTHKSLRGPRGAMCMCKEEHAKAVDRAIFPGLQGGPHMHTISGIAVAMGEALTDDFKIYAAQVVKNARRLAEKLMEYGFELVSGGTDNHLILIDMRNKNIPGKKMAKALDRARIVTNCNTVPNDPAPPFNPSGVRIGTPSVTSMGMKEDQMDIIARYFNEVAENIENPETIERIGKEVMLLCSEFPLPDFFVK